VTPPVTALTRRLRESLDPELPAVLCNPRDTPPDALKQEWIDALEVFAARTSGLLYTTLAQTWEQALAERPRLLDYERLVLQSWSLGDRDRLLSGLAWMLAVTGAREACGILRRSEERRSTRRWDLALALVHLSTSRELLARAVFDAFLGTPRMVQRDFPWAAQAPAIASISAALASVMDGPTTLTSGGEAPEGAGEYRRADNVRLRQKGGALPVRCAPEVHVRHLRNPVLHRAGGLLAVDTRFDLTITCDNVGEHRLVSESLVSASPPDRCLFDGGREVVLGELDPGESASLRLGPFLAASSCSSFVRTYRLVSSHHEGSVEVSLVFAPFRPAASGRSCAEPLQLPTYVRPPTYRVRRYLRLPLEQR